MELRKNNFLYSSFFIQKFINNIIKNGKKQKVENCIFASLKFLKFKLNQNPFFLYMYILAEIRPYIILKSLRLGSMVYKIPVPLSWDKQLLKAIKLLRLVLLNNKLNVGLKDKLISEFFLVLNKKSLVFKYNQQLYSTASNNRSFSHFRW